MNFANFFLSLSLIFSLSIHGYSPEKDPEKSGGIKEEIKILKKRLKEYEVSTSNSYGENVSVKYEPSNL